MTQSIAQTEKAKLPERQCGDCTLCCKLIAVEELNKPQNVWCKHCYNKTGCRIHGLPERPDSCGEFECLWLMGIVPEWFRPKEAKFVLWLTSDGKRITLFEDPNYPNEWRKPQYYDWLMGLVDKGVDLIITNTRHIFSSNPDTIQLVEIGLQKAGETK